MDLPENKHDDLLIFDPEDFRQEGSQYSFEEQGIDQYWKNRQFLSSLDFAWSGIRTAIREERNMKKHLLAALAISLLGLVLGLSTLEWLFLFSAVFGVMALELFNSAIENVVDLVCGKTFSSFAKNAKDMAAGAVLLWSMYAVLVGLLIFVPKLWALLV